MAKITVGARLPGAQLMHMGAEGPEAVDLGKKLAGRKVALFGLPGAYTAPCTNLHVPSFIRTAGKLRDKGVDEIICVAVNDPFVMGAWAESTGGAAAGISFLGDSDGAFTRAIGMAFDAPPLGLHGRSLRYSLLAEDGVIKALNVEEDPTACKISAGEALLESM